MVYWIGYFFFHIFRLIWFPCRITGLQNIPKIGAFIFASNHASNLDPFLLGILPRREVYFFAKKELFKHPVAGWLQKEWHAFPADRNRADIGALKKAIWYLRHGSPLIFFPEGTRAGSGREQRVFSGIGFLVNKTNVPVVPAYIQDSDKCLPPGARFPKRTWVTIRIGSPVFFPETASHQDIASTVMARIQGLKPV